MELLGLGFKDRGLRVFAMMIYGYMVVFQKFGKSLLRGITRLYLFCL